MKRTYQPSKLVRKRRHGFRARMATKNGRQVLARRRARAASASARKGSFVTAALGRLRKRSEFLAVASANRRSATPGLVLQAKARRDDEALSGEPTFRIGFTATKKIGNAVVRNRARRRLRAAVREVLGVVVVQAASVDLVLVARHGTTKRNYGELKNDLAQSLKRLGVLG